MADNHLKVTSTAPRIQYVSTNLQTVFTIPFRFFADGDIQIFSEDDTTALSNSLYTIVGAGLNVDGTLTFSVGRTLNENLTLIRSSTIERTVDFVDSGDWEADNVNDQLDKLTMFIQEVEVDSTDLAVTLPNTTLLSSLTFPDQGATLNSLKLIGWDAAGTALRSPSAAPSQTTT